MLLAAHESTQVREVTDDHERGQPAGHRDVERRSVAQRHDRRERQRAHDRRDRRLPQPAGDPEPHRAEHRGLEGEHDGQDAGRGGDTPAAFEAPGDGEHVPDDRGHAEDERAAVPVERDAGARRGRALADVEDEHEEPGLPAEEPERVRRARVAGPFAEDVVAPGAGDERGARERPEEVGHREEAPDEEHGRKSLAPERSGMTDAPAGVTLSSQRLRVPAPG